MFHIVVVDFLGQLDDARLNKSHGNDDLRHVVYVVLFGLKQLWVVGVVDPHHFVVLQGRAELFVLLLFDESRFSPFYSLGLWPRPV